VFDCPGYGHSDRPRSSIWTPEAQADLIQAAVAGIGVERATVLGHSWGCAVAVALAHKYPGLVAGLVLASGYYYPTARPDVVGMAAPAVPLVGDIIRYTISPILSRLMWPLLMRKLFGPQSEPEKFVGFSKALAVRPSQICECRRGGADAPRCLRLPRLSIGMEPGPPIGVGPLGRTEIRRRF
jgi:pimeloyl-ACP methyl ester carboxylesterase